MDTPTDGKHIKRLGPRSERGATADAQRAHGRDLGGAPGASNNHSRNAWVQRLGEQYTAKGVAREAHKLLTQGSEDEKRRMLMFLLYPLTEDSLDHALYKLFASRVAGIGLQALEFVIGVKQFSLAELASTSREIGRQAFEAAASKQLNCGELMAIYARPELNDPAHVHVLSDTICKGLQELFGLEITGA